MRKKSHTLKLGKHLSCARKNILKVNNMPEMSAQPQVGKTLKLCKKNYFEGT